MQSLRLVLSDRVSAAAIALIAGCLMLFQAIAGNAAEIAMASDVGVICSTGSASAGTHSGDERGRHSGALCGECCAVCHISRIAALPLPEAPRPAPIRLRASPVERPQAQAPPRPLPRATSRLSRGPPVLS